MRQWRFGAITFSFVITSFAVVVEAGMGVPIPVEVDYEELPQIRALSPWLDARIQTLSFFLFALLLVAVIVRFLWNLLRRDWPKLPEMTFRGALISTGLWALLSIVILTMISGARELMTPGAWKQHGWTYQLNPETTTATRSDSEMNQLMTLQRRYEGIKRLGEWLNAYADKHEKYPDAPSNDPLWEVATAPGFHYQYRPCLSRYDNDVLAYEPFTEGPCYIVTTSGDVGMVGQSEIQDFRVSDSAKLLPAVITPSAVQ